MRSGGPKGVARPFTPALGLTPEEDAAEALDHIARARSAIDHNLEIIAQAMLEKGR
jgi:hypothetical protein